MSPVTNTFLRPLGYSPSADLLNQLPPSKESKDLSELWNVSSTFQSKLIQDILYTLLASLDASLAAKVCFPCEPISRGPNHPFKDILSLLAYI